MLIKILASVLLTVVAAVVMGLSGLSFYLWPTGLNDRTLSLSPVVMKRLQSLHVERKFDADKRTFYPGARNEKARVEAQAVVDTVIRSLMTELPKHPRRSTVLKIMKAALSSYETVESEERDQLLVYLSKVMEICGVESSSELFNVWRYGFPYGWIL